MSVVFGSTVCTLVFSRFAADVISLAINLISRIGLDGVMVEVAEARTWRPASDREADSLSVDHHHPHAATPSSLLAHFNHTPRREHQREETKKPGLRSFSNLITKPRSIRRGSELRTTMRSNAKRKPGMGRRGKFIYL